MTEQERYAYRYSTDESGAEVVHTRYTVGWDNVDTLVTRGIDRYGWREVDYWRVDEYGRPLVDEASGIFADGDYDGDPFAESPMHDATVESVEAREDDGPYCYCGHVEDRHGQGESGRECWGCRDDEYATAPTTHDYERSE